MKIQFENSFYTSVVQRYAYSEEATQEDVNYYYNGVCIAIDHLEKMMLDGVEEEDMSDILRAHTLLKEELHTLMYRLHNDFK